MLKPIRSNKVYVPLIIMLGAAALFCGYYFFYVSLQRSYANDRAFRLLSVVCDQLVQRYENLSNVFGAAMVSSRPEDYLKEVLKDEISDASQVCAKSNEDAKRKEAAKHNGDAKRNPNAKRNGYAKRNGDAKRNGELTLRLIEKTARSFSLGATFESTQGPRAATCSISGQLDLNADLAERFRNVTEEYFDDILIATSEGEMLFQKNTSGARITNLNTLLPPKPSGSKSAKPDEDPKKTVSGSGEQATGFQDASQFSNVIDVKLMDARYKLYVQPVPFKIVDKEGHSVKLIVCGLWRADRLQSEVVSIPHSTVIWAALVVLSVFALGWPLLKVAYMSPSERLRRKHVFYMVCSALFATATLTLLVLNWSYVLREDEESGEQLKALADRIELNVNQELKRTLEVLDALDNSDYLHEQFQKTTEKQWRAVNFLQSPFAKKHTAPVYPYFDNIFWVDSKGRQQFKLTVNPSATPRTPIVEPYFRDILAGQHLSRAPDVWREFRFDSLYSRNTGEFFAVLARPYATPEYWKDVPAKYFGDLKAEVLVTRFLSLVDPVMPEGFGYALVDRDGLVHFHSSPARNKIENFFKECNQDPVLRAAVVQGDRRQLEVNYMGKRQDMQVRPMPQLGNPAPSLVVFRDRNYFTTVNVACMLVFALEMGLFSLPFGVVLAVYVFRRGDYPLSGLWPGSAEIHKYVNLIVAGIGMTTAYAIQFQSMKMDANLVAVVTMTAAIVIFGLLKQIANSTRLALLGKAPVLAAILVILACGTLPSHRWVVALLAGLYIGLSVPAISKALDEFATRFLKVRYTYLAAALSLLVVLVVAPCFGLFKIAYDTVNRLALESSQLARRDQLMDRVEKINRYFVDPKADKGHVEQRIREPLDRYDEPVFYPGSHKDMIRANRDISILEKPIALAAAWFPSNRLGAKLRLRAAEDAGHGPWWTSARDDDDQLLWLSGDLPVGDLRSVYPIWFLPRQAGILMALLAVLLAAWLNYIIRKVFLTEVEEVPELDNWVVSESRRRNLLIIDHPMSGKSTLAKSLPEVDVLDLATAATAGDWSLKACEHPAVVVDRFEFDMDNPDTCLAKLKLLEQILYVENKHVILLSAVDPMFYLTSNSPAIVTPNNGSHEVPAHLLDRWATVISMFEKAKVEDLTDFNDVFAVERNPCRETVRMIENECGYTAELRRIGIGMLKAYSRKDPVSKARFLEDLLDRAEGYYRVLWSTCAKDERLVLFQLAQDGWANPKNERAIQQLQRRQIIRRGSGYRIMNDSFRQWIRTAQCPEEMARWEEEEQHSTWSAMKLGLTTTLLMFGAWLLYTQQDVFQMGIGYVAALGTASGAIMNLARSVKGKTAAPVSE